MLKFQLFALLAIHIYIYIISELFSIIFTYVKISVGWNNKIYVYVIIKRKYYRGNENIIKYEYYEVMKILFPLMKYQKSLKVK